MKISIVIPNYNGKKLLSENLPNVTLLKNDEIIVVDDGSKDESTAFLKENYPHIKVIKNESNLGFIKSVNTGFRKATGDYVILLNSDVSPKNNFVEVLEQYFLSPKIFAVSFNEPNWSYAVGEFKNGYIEHHPGPKTEAPHITFWASGGSAIFRKSIWDELGGFDELYEPFYWEDIDLSYRAWKNGYEIWWEPNAIVTHNHETTISSNFSKNFVDMVSERNRLLFIWKNVKDKDLIIEHRKYLFHKLKKIAYWKPFLEALSKRNNIKSEKFNLSDKEIFNKFK